MDSMDPTVKWETGLKDERIVMQLNHTVFKGKAEKPKGVTRVVCISDTHSRHKKISSIPDGDVLLHGGDFSEMGGLHEIEAFNTWLGTLPHKHKLVIAGNHDLSLDEGFRESLANEQQKAELKRRAREAEALLTNCTYLRDSSVTVNGIHVYGSPWQPEFCDWGFNVPRGEKLKGIWEGIPSECDVLVTHGPPLGYGDRTEMGERAGCEHLLYKIEEVKPVLHVFGHIHEGYGVQFNGHTVLANASTCNFRYRPNNSPLVFDLMQEGGKVKVRLPPSQRKQVAAELERLRTEGGPEGTSQEKESSSGGGGGGGSGQGAHKESRP